MEGKKGKMSRRKREPKSVVVELIAVLLNKIIKKFKRAAGSKRIISERHEHDNII